ncbi:MAG TPA: hypothetical protein VGO07_04205, partial [Candidatus Saccharimonadales bacterium]|nr:hypothetical protein [Candidatus Saccharimonadales bacterium]
APNEEFLVGQDRTIRVFSFGRPLSVERQQDLERFVDIATQFMGDRVYDFISDVVIGEFANNTSHKDAKKDEDEFAGFAFPGNGVVLVNSSILRDDAPVDKGAEGSLFLQTLLHEFGGHLLHGDIRNDPQAREDLEEFAAAVGWRMEEMRENGHDWTAKGADNKPYAPFYATPHTIFMPAGGSPTEYGTANPMETAGETSKHMMLGSKVMDMMTETDSAWFAYLQKRLLKPGEVMGDQPIATPLERKPITITRYTGTDIRYPQSEPLSISTL